MSNTGEVNIAPRRYDRQRLPRVGNGRKRRSLRVFLTDEEMVILEARANATGRSKSRLLVEAALYSDARGAYDPASLAKGLETLSDLRRQVRGMATNVNQIAHHANATQTFPADADVVLQSVARLTAHMEEVLERLER